MTPNSASSAVGSSETDNIRLTRHFKKKLEIQPVNDIITGFDDIDKFISEAYLRFKTIQKGAL